MFNFLFLWLKENISESRFHNDTPTKTIKGNCDIFKLYYFNSTISTSTFSTAIKKAEVNPVFKKNSRTHKANYRIVSLIPVISKKHEISTIRCLTVSKPYFENINEVSEKVTVH